MSVSQIGCGLYLSDLDAALNRSVLRSRRVTLIVNCSGREDLRYPPLDGLRVLQVPVQDRPHAPLDRYFRLVSDSILQNGSGSTLVHCSAGRSRSAAVVMAHLMRCEGLSLSQAHRRLLERRPFVRPNVGFWRQLMALEQRLFGSASVQMSATPAGVLPVLQDAPRRRCVNM
ncbi:dual specificity protein phosphatase 14-like [Synchiropus picturatus]